MIRILIFSFFFSCFFSDTPPWITWVDMFGPYGTTYRVEVNNTQKVRFKSFYEEGILTRNRLIMYYEKDDNTDLFFEYYDWKLEKITDLTTGQKKGAIISKIEESPYSSLVDTIIEVDISTFLNEPIEMLITIYEVEKFEESSFFLTDTKTFFSYEADEPFTTLEIELFNEYASLYTEYKYRLTSYKTIGKEIHSQEFKFGENSKKATFTLDFGDETNEVYFLVQCSNTTDVFDCNLLITGTGVRMYTKITAQNDYALSITQVLEILIPILASVVTFFFIIIIIAVCVGGAIVYCCWMRKKEKNEGNYSDSGSDSSGSGSSVSVEEFEPDSDEELQGKVLAKPNENDYQLRRKILKEEETCVVCMDKRRVVKFLPCEHLCCCEGCFDGVKRSNNQCPICRKTIETVELLNDLIEKDKKLFKKKEVVLKKKSSKKVKFAPIDLGSSI